MDESHDLPPRQVFLFGFFFEISLVIVAAGIGYLTRGVAFPFRFSLDLEGLCWGLLATAPLLLLAVLLTAPLGRRFGPFRRIYEKVKAVLGAALCEMSALDRILLAGAAGIGEEVLFRGVLQTVIGTQGLWLSSVLFGALHALTYTYAIFATLLGLYLGWIFERTGNLLAPVLVHAIYDAVALWLLRKRFLEDRSTAGG